MSCICFLTCLRTQFKQGNWTMSWPFEVQSQFYWSSEEQTSSQDATQFVYVSVTVLLLNKLKKVPLFWSFVALRLHCECPLIFWQATSHVRLPGDGNNYIGVEATLDVYGFNLDSDQLSQAGVWVVNRGDGQPSSFTGFQAGWHVSHICI